MGKGLSWALTIIGVLLLAAGLVLMLAIVPGMKKMPADTDTTRDYEGTMVALLNPADFTFQKMLPITLTRHFAVTETDGDLALVKEEKTMMTGSTPLQQVVTHYAVDRVTMLASADYPEDWATSEGFIPREGIVLSWPMDTEQKDYTGWSDDYMSHRSADLRRGGDPRAQRHDALQVHLGERPAADRPRDGDVDGPADRAAQGAGPGAARAARPRRRFPATC